MIKGCLYLGILLGAKNKGVVYVWGRFRIPIIKGSFIFWLASGAQIYMGCLYLGFFGSSNIKGSFIFGVALVAQI